MSKDRFAARRQPLYKTEFIPFSRIAFSSGASALSYQALASDDCHSTSDTVEYFFTASLNDFDICIGEGEGCCFAVEDDESAIFTPFRLDASFPVLPLPFVEPAILKNKSPVRAYDLEAISDSLGFVFSGSCTILYTLSMRS